MKSFKKLFASAALVLASVFAFNATAAPAVNNVEMTQTVQEEQQTDIIIIVTDDEIIIIIIER